MPNVQFTPVDHDPFNIQQNASGVIGTMAHYLVPGIIGAQMAGTDTANLAKGIARNVGTYARALQGENIPLDDLIDASNTVAGLVATGGLGASVPKGAIGANILSYSKQDLLANVEPSLQDTASEIFDTMQKTGLHQQDAAYSLAKAKGLTIDSYLNHVDSAIALGNSAKKLSSSVSLASSAEPDKVSIPYVPPAKETVSTSMTPINWQDYMPPDIGKAGGDWLRANPDVANLLFAKQAGFNTNVPLYKGMARPLEGEGFYPEHSSTSEPALFFATEPDVAAFYSAPPTSMSYPEWRRNPSSIIAYARAQNPFQVDWRSIGGDPEYTAYKMSALLEDAQARSADLLAIHNINDIAYGGFRPQTQIAVMDPSILRSPWAQFDPNRLHEADLLASRGLPLFIPVDHDPFASQRGQ